MLQLFAEQDAKLSDERISCEIFKPTRSADLPVWLLRAYRVQPLSKKYFSSPLTQNHF
jgi:hypothetical protein